jgi:hypothetical protein
MAREKKFFSNTGRRMLDNGNEKRTNLIMMMFVEKSDELLNHLNNLKTKRRLKC